MKVALIGGGSIACVIVRSLLDKYPDIRIVGVLGHDLQRAKGRLDGRVPLTSSIDDLLSGSRLAGKLATGHGPAGIIRRTSSSAG